MSFADEAEWTLSPMVGVERRMLERGIGEMGRATGVVRYRPGSQFPPRGHALGEEFLVLQGTFADEPGAVSRRHLRPRSAGIGARVVDRGGVRAVRQAAAVPSRTTVERVVVDTRSAEWFPGLTRGIAVLPLHGFGSERVSLVRWAPNIRFLLHAHPGGEEIFVLEGAVEDDEGRYMAGSWLRNPPGSQHAPFSLEGCLLYVKIGHLPAVVT